MKYLVLYKITCDHTAHAGVTADHVFISLTSTGINTTQPRTGARWPLTDGDSLKIKSHTAATIGAVFGYQQADDEDQILVELINYHGASKRLESLGVAPIQVRNVGTEMQTMQFSGESSDYTLYYYFNDAPILGAKLTGINCFLTTDDSPEVIKAINLAFGAAANVARAAGAAIQQMDQPKAKVIGVAVQAASEVLDAIPDFINLIAGATDNPDEIFLNYGMTEDRDQPHLYPTNLPYKQFMNGEMDDLIDGDNVFIPVLGSTAQVALYEGDPDKANVVGVANIENLLANGSGASSMQGYALFTGGMGKGGTGNALYGISYLVEDMVPTGIFGV